MARTKHLKASKPKRVRKSRRTKRPGGGFWGLFVLFFVWFVTGFPMAIIRPNWVTVTAKASYAPLGASAVSWKQDLTTNMSQDLSGWATSNGIDPSALEGAIKAASLERDPKTGLPQPGTGLKVDVFTLLGISSIESNNNGSQTDPLNPGPTGGCNASWELSKHPLLNAASEELALRKVANDLGLPFTKVYGSCGAGAIGWNQALPSNWERLMGSGWNPWDRQDAAEFTARYLVETGHFFTRGRKDAVRSYNPKAPDSMYADLVVGKAEQLEQSFLQSGLALQDTIVVPKKDESKVVVEKPEEPTQLPVETTLPTTKAQVKLAWPLALEAPRGGVPFGVPSKQQSFGHTGVDIIADEGTSVKAAGPGLVVYAGWWPEGGTWKLTNNGHGNTVILYHGTVEGKSVFTFYAHLSEFLVKAGDYVDGGTEIALSGNTGASDGPHLHFAVRTGGGFTYEKTDEFGSWSDGNWADPDEWAGPNTSDTVLAEIPTGPYRTVQASEKEEEVTLVLVTTPAVKFSAWLYSVTEDLKVGAGLLDKASKLPIYEEQVSKSQKFLNTVISLLQTIQGITSKWAIGGQPRSLKLNPLLYWSIVEVGGEVKSP